MPKTKKTYVQEIGADGQISDRRRGVSWRWHFDQLVRRHYGIKREGAGGKTSYRTQEYILETTFLLMNALRDELGFKLIKPANFDARHALAWAKWINALYHDGQRQPATLAGYATTARHLFRWSDNVRLVEIFDAELDSSAVSRELAASTDKSWEGNAISFEEAFDGTWSLEPWVAMCLAAQETFGLRRREAVMLNPLRDIDLKEGVIRIRVGAKGGRPRLIPIDNHWLHMMGERLIKFVQIRNLQTARDDRESMPIAPEGLSLQQAIKRYANVMTSLGYTKENAGVTGHGLRAGYVCRRLIALGVTPVVRGGDGVHPDAAHDEIAHTLVTEAVGHSRKSVLGAYSGSPHAVVRVQAVQQLRHKGWLLPGTDAATVKENLRRREAFIDNPGGFGIWIRANHPSIRAPKPAMPGSHLWVNEGGRHVE